MTLFLSDLASVTFRAPSSGQVGGPVPPSSGTTAATIGSTSGSADSNSSAPSSAPASLGGLHAMLGLPPPFCGVGGVRAEGSWRLRLPHLGKMPRVTAAAGSTTGSTGSKGGSISGSALVSEHSPVSFVVENPGLALRGAVMEFAVKLGPGLTPADVTLTVDDEVGTWRDGRGMARWEEAGHGCVVYWIWVVRLAQKHTVRSFDRGYSPSQIGEYPRSPAILPPPFPPPSLIGHPPCPPHSNLPSSYFHPSSPLRAAWPTCPWTVRDASYCRQSPPGAPAVCAHGCAAHVRAGFL